MRTRVLVAVAALLAAGALAGCARTVPGTVAMTTEPGFSTRSSSPSTSGPSPSTPGSSPDVPAPPNSQTMTCEEFTALDPDTQAAVINEILGDLGPMIGDEDGERMRMAAAALCQFMPGDVVLSEILMGGSPP
jgi:hypothetical protein